MPRRTAWIRYGLASSIVFAAFIGLHGGVHGYVVLPLLLPVALVWRERDREAAIALTVLTLEGLAAHSLWHTFGEVTSGAYHLLLWLNVIPIAAIAASGRARRLGVGTLATGLLLLGAWPTYLAVEWAFIHAEATRIAAYARNHHRAAGEFPPLDGYTFRFEWTRAHIAYNPVPHPTAPAQDGPQFHLAYHVGTPNTAHVAMNNGARWFYYPD